MNDTSYDESVLKEIEEAIDLNREFSDKKKVPIIFDGKQYTIKIPKKMADKIGISHDDEFEFETITRMEDSKIRSKLQGRLIKDEPAQE